MKEKVLVVHNAYQHKGGEDTVVESECQMLRKFGHDVEVYTRHNDNIALLGNARLVKQTLWSSTSSSDIAEVIRRFHPDVIHVHNTFPLISPSIYWRAAESGIPVVQTLHNFRLMCPQAMFLRDGDVCEDCLGHVPWRGVMRKCYRESMVQSAVLGAMVTLHRGMGTWRNKITRYIALNDFCRNKFIQGGLPASKIVIKPNFVDFDAPPSVLRQGFLFVGRLSKEKGVSTLVSAMASMPAEVSVNVAGTGPEQSLIEGRQNVIALGALSTEQVRQKMSSALALVLPSIWYENFPRTLVEAFACGLPVIASRIGALAELVEDGVTGLLFDPGDAEDLAAKLRWAVDNRDAMAAMGKSARLLYEREFTIERNYNQLVTIYKEAIAETSGVYQ
ncbi:glycosyltransferase family 4 protein [Methylobacillus sp.]|mgnify:CR=1 FL=1|uniref:glycosyltransferase family 4 protein n=1 Tax=Methylobacillus sp. TaxID=56818 RepID=UPI002FE09FEB